MIAIIKADFNKEITDLLLQGCEEHLKKENVAYDLFTCPGAVETVVYTTKLMEEVTITLSPKYKSIIVIGAIIKGDTDHYEYVCNYVTNGFAQIAATKTTPVIFGILTTQTEELAMERAALDKMNKGKEFAETAIFMVEAFAKI